MDLRIDDQTATAVERQAVDAVLGAPDSAWVGAERPRSTATSPAAATPPATSGTCCCRRCTRCRRGSAGSARARSATSAAGSTIPPAEAYGVASFYALFSLDPRPPVVAHVCDDIACMCRGGAELVADLERTVGPAGEHPGNGRAIWLESPCLGLCERAPAALVTQAGEDPAERSIAPAGAAAVADALARQAARPGGADPIAQRGDESARLLRRVGVVDPESLDDYRAHGGYDALRRAFALGPAGVIREVTDSKLLGRGGAAFPTGRKWDAVARKPVRPALPGLQRRRVRAGHVQGPGRDGAGSVRASSRR